MGKAKSGPLQAFGKFPHFLRSPPKVHCDLVQTSPLLRMLLAFFSLRRPSCASRYVSPRRHLTILFYCDHSGGGSIWFEFRVFYCRFIGFELLRSYFSGSGFLADRRFLSARRAELFGSVRPKVGFFFFVFCPQWNGNVLLCFCFFDDSGLWFLVFAVSSIMAGLHFVPFWDSSDLSN